jgi:glycosyltransferase involved in cell wall biosynthesis
VSPTPHVAVLLCTFNGQRYLQGQLDSIAAQTHQAWSVWASDDGSTDGTKDVLAHYRDMWGADRLTLVTGPAEGATRNFSTLAALDRIQAQAYAYADQDDVWERGKLERALAWLGSVPDSTPALYCSRTVVIDDQDATIGLSPLFGRPPSFGNALAQNIASGNTMVFNDAARRLLVAAEHAGARPVFHDWWTYLLVTGSGGQVRYDPTPTVRYRQHGNNQVGANVGVRDRVANAHDSVWQRLRPWTDQNLAALDLVTERLTAASRATLTTFRHARERSLIPRLIGLGVSGVHRQTIVGNVSLIVAALFRRF